MNIKKQPANFFYSLFLLNMVLGLSFSAYAEDQLSAPQLVIEYTSKKIRTQLQQPGFTNDRQKIIEFIENEIFTHVDFYRMSALVLGKHWRQASKQQKHDFTREFKQLLIRTYVSTYTDQFKEWTVRYLPLKLQEGATKANVKTHILQPGKQPINVDYAMAFRKGVWKVYDIKIEGISLVITNRNTFNTMVKNKGSLDAVIAELSRKNKLKKEQNS